MPSSCSSSTRTPNPRPHPHLARALVDVGRRLWLVNEVVVAAGVTAVVPPLRGVIDRPGR
jgi:hypothetical protein